MHAWRHIWSATVYFVISVVVYDVDVVLQGSDLDLLAWEQSMNCGRTARPIETFTRSAMRMRKSPAVLYIASGTPSWKAADCENTSALVPYTFGPNEISLLSKPVKLAAADSNLMKEFRYLKPPSGPMLYDVYAGPINFILA
jgi:hypothetical protein